MKRVWACSDMKKKTFESLVPMAFNSDDTHYVN